jgi:hypothetical protein
MFGTRFERRVGFARHAAWRMVARDIDEVLLLQMLDEGGLRYQDDAQL